MTEQRLMTAREAADYLGVSVRTLRRWRRQGLGPAAVRFGSVPTAAYRYLMTTLDRWVQEQERAPGEDP